MRRRLAATPRERYHDLTMTPRENLALLLSGGSPAWIPFTMDVGASDGFTAAVMERFTAETGSDNPAEWFDYDLRIASLARAPGGEDPGSRCPDAPAGTVFDEWGVGHWAGGARDTYERMFAPLASAEGPRDVESLPEPVISDGGAADAVRRFHERGYPVAGYAGSVYEWSWWLRGMERFLMDTVENLPLAQAIVDKVAGFTARLALASAEAGIDVLAFYDDAGSQSGLQVSPALWRSLVKPAWRRVLDTVRARHPRTAFFFHSCGDITDIVPDIVELGFSILHPVQPECMDAAAVKAAWGSRIVPCATIGAQRALSLGTAEEVRRETARLMDTLGADRRCIVCPSNRVQPETPWENVMAFAQAARGRRQGPGARTSR
jgi:uroporphyrinogen decarboxylase